jgi:hypothetical protein
MDARAGEVARPIRPGAFVTDGVRGGLEHEEGQADDQGGNGEQRQAARRPIAVAGERLAVAFHRPRRR